MNKIITEKSNQEPGNFAMGDILYDPDDNSDLYILCKNPIGNWIAVRLATGGSWNGTHAFTEVAAKGLSFWGRRVKIKLEKSDE